VSAPELVALQRYSASRCAWAASNLSKIRKPTVSRRKPITKPGAGASAAASNRLELLQQGRHQFAHGRMNVHGPRDDAAVTNGARWIRGTLTMQRREVTALR
jgi:hypothetical protein